MTAGHECRHFFGVGAQKAGTTWLQAVLDSHPECALSPLKELHFFDQRYLEGKLRPTGVLRRRTREMAQLASDIALGDNLQQPLTGDGARARERNTRLRRIEHISRCLRIDDPAGYVRYLDDIRREKGARITGDITPAYSMLPARAFAEMDALIPGCLFLFVLRDPLERFLSQLRFQRRVHERNGDPGFDPDKPFQAAVSDPSFLQRSDYQRTITSLESVVSPDRILYMFFEEMIALASMGTSIRRIEAFLGISPRPDTELDRFRNLRANASKPLDFSREQRAQAREALEPVYRYVASRFGGLPPDWSRPESP